jgi:hypothetical protein
MLDDVRVASPCNAAWDQMEGDDRARFCRLCSKHVYNLSNMSRKEAEARVREKEGRLCVRFYRRRDGTLLTDNCPVGFRAARRWLLTHVGAITAAFGLITLLAPLARSETFRRARRSRLAQVEPFRTIFEWIDPMPPPSDFVVLGVIAAPPGR